MRPCVDGSTMADEPFRALYNTSLARRNSDVQLERNYHRPWPFCLSEPHLLAKHQLRSKLPRPATRGQVPHKNQPPMCQARRPHRLQCFAHLFQLVPRQHNRDNSSVIAKVSLVQPSPIDSARLHRSQSYLAQHRLRTAFIDKPCAIFGGSRTGAVAD